jgi:hypothetical protein
MIVPLFLIHMKVTKMKILLTSVILPILLVTSGCSYNVSHAQVKKAEQICDNVGGFSELRVTPIFAMVVVQCNDLNDYRVNYETAPSAKK